jgi:hypothetical protein
MVCSPGFGIVLYENRHHNSVSEMLNTMNWQTLQERRLRTRLIMFHKVINENIAIPTQNILLQSK